MFGAMELAEHKSLKVYPEFEYISPIQTVENDWDNQQVPEKSRKAESVKGKKKQNSRTMDWLEENYTKTEGICLPRCILYDHYRDFCKRTDQEPACAATFGKMIRQKFPGITTRRLGTRGHSKYHYYGIGIRETSPYYHTVYSSKGLTRFSTNLGSDERNSHMTRSVPIKFDSNTLSEYPDISKIVLAPSKEFENFQVEDLLQKHRDNCLNITRSLAQRNFSEVQSITVNFWRSLPQYCYPLLHDDVIIDVICLGDSVLYKNLVDVLIPVTKENVSESALEEMRFIAKNWEEWELTSLVGLPQTFVKKKLAISHQFAQSVKRQCTFLHLAKTTSNILTDSSKVQAMISDISKVDLGSIGSQAFYASTESEGQDNELNAELLKDLKDLLQGYSSLEKYISWLDSIIEKRVIKPSKQNGRSTKKRAQDFLLKWSFFGARIMHNLTLNNAVSFGSFHVLRMLFDEYILFGVETQFNNEKDQELATTVEKHMRKEARASANFYSAQVKDKRNSIPHSDLQPRPTVISQVYSGQSAFSPFQPHCQVPSMYMDVSPAAKVQQKFMATQFSPDIIHHSDVPGFYNRSFSSPSTYAASSQIGFPSVIGPVPNNDSFPSTDVLPVSSQESLRASQSQRQGEHRTEFSVPSIGVTPSNHQCVSVISTVAQPQNSDKMLDHFCSNQVGEREVSPLEEITSNSKDSLGSIHPSDGPESSAINGMGFLGTYDRYINTMQQATAISHNFSQQQSVCDSSSNNGSDDFAGDLYDAVSNGQSKSVQTAGTEFSTMTGGYSGVDIGFQDY